MASTTRGSIKISTANGIGAALVDVLGGEGYKPDEWEQNINLCGIHAADIESALENIEEDAGTGTERGSILLSTANAIGAMLNKKFNTSRGFSPREWASAASKLEPLPERTASGAIANITDGADGVPLKNWLVTLPASLDGYTAIGGNKGGKNFLPIAVDYPNFTQTKNDMTISVLANGKVKFNGTTTANTDFTFYSASTPSEPHLFVCNGTYTFSNIGSNSVKMVVSGGNNNGFPYREIANGSYTGTVTDETKPFNYVIFRISSGVTLLDVEIEPMLEVGSTATAYEAYTAPTQYTASLGRTIYGGTADIVTGGGEDDRLKYELDDNDLWSAYGGATHSFWHNVAIGEDRPIDQTKLTQCICNELTYSTTAPASAPDFTFMVQGGQRIVVTADSSIDTVDKFKTWLSSHNLVFVCPASAPTAFTFTPITPTPETALGSNNFWSDQGESSVTYRKDLDIPDPVPGNLLGMNNGNNNEEESEG